MFNIRDKIAPRLKACRTANGWTFAESAKRLAAVIGAPVIPSRYGNWELGINTPPLEIFIGLGKLFGRPPAWLAGLTDDDGKAPETQHYSVPPLSTVPSACGTVDLGEDALAFHNTFLERHKLKRENILLVEAPDDAMTGIIDQGDLALIDLAETRVTRNDIFAIMVNGRLWLRWIRQEIAGDYAIQAEKRERYPDQPVSAEQLNSLHILGRVRVITHLR